MSHFISQLKRHNHEEVFFQSMPRGIAGKEWSGCAFGSKGKKEVSVAKAQNASSLVAIISKSLKNHQTSLVFARIILRFLLVISYLVSHPAAKPAGFLLEVKTIHSIVLA
ncbi:MAG: hypothetical protein GX163_03795 [Bacteroidetes bacterium]|nr:hypothetical protein [Bacteroidota bacterium]